MFSALFQLFARQPGAVMLCRHWFRTASSVSCSRINDSAAEIRRQLACACSYGSAQLLAELMCACLLLPLRRHTGYAGSEATVDSRCPAVSHASVQTGCSNGHRNSPVGPQRQAQCRLRLAGCSQRLEERAGCLGYESVIVVSHHVLACLSR